MMKFSSANESRLFIYVALAADLAIAITKFSAASFTACGSHNKKLA
ncbi:MAG TPA: hypothetical protein VFP87_08555 [Chitinophagaceae bacterium]|nr:hypothetical protein [Chitinophagaceae bacterium]